VLSSLNPLRATAAITCRCTSRAAMKSDGIVKPREWLAFFPRASEGSGGSA
jgi:hypothetical protein